MIAFAQLARGLPMTWSRRWPCARKIRHATMEQAIAALHDMLAWPDVKDPETLNAYQCEHCAGYHVGHLEELRTWQKQND